MKKWLYLTISAAIVALSLFLRLYKIENRAPFDWDQNRDYLAVEQITKGKFTLVGPVAKGEGGFLLGPLYYYLSVPGFLLGEGDPISLPMTSVILDTLAIIAVLVYFPKIWGKWQTLILGLSWSLSWFAIESSRVSWNVAMLQVWLVTFMYLLSSKLKSYNYLILGLILGLTWHIHAVIIPLSIIIFTIYFKKLKPSFVELVYVSLGYLIALSPLIIFDLRHVGLEHNLVMQYLSGSSSGRAGYSDVLVSLLSRFGKNTVAIFSGNSNLDLGWGITATMLSIFAIFRGSQLAKLSGIIVLVNLALVFYLGEVRFPEYYLASSYLPVIIIAIDYFSNCKKIFIPVAIVLASLFLYFNLSNFTTAKTAFSLAQKSELSKKLASISNEADVVYDLPFGRNSGIPVLLQRDGVTLNSNSKNRFLVTESTSESVFHDGEFLDDLGWFGGFRLSYAVVQ